MRPLQLPLFSQAHQTMRELWCEALLVRLQSWGSSAKEPSCSPGEHLLVQFDLEV